MAKLKCSCKVQVLRKLLMELQPHYIIKLNKVGNFSIFDPHNNNNYLGFIDLSEERIDWEA